MKTNMLLVQVRVCTHTPGALRTATETWTRTWTRNPDPDPPFGDPEKRLRRQRRDFGVQQTRMLCCRVRTASLFF